MDKLEVGKRYTSSNNSYWMLADSISISVLEIIKRKKYTKLYTNAGRKLLKEFEVEYEPHAE